MKRRVDPFKLGLFVLCGAAIIVGGLVWIGAAHLFEKNKTYVTFFDQSVEGLNTGSNVNRLGIQVGRVSSISLAQNGQLVQVEMKISSDFPIQKGEAVEMEKAGLTGGHFLAIVPAPENLEQATPKINFPTKYPLIPSVKGPIASLETTVENIFKKFQNVNAQGLLSSWAEVGQSANKILSNKDIDETLKNFKEASAALRTLLAGVGKNENVTRINTGIKDFAAAASSAQKAGGSISSQVEAIPPNTIAQVTERVDKAAKEAEQAAGSLSSEMTRTLSAFQESADQLNQVLSEVEALVQSLREEPGRILQEPRGSEPFRK